MANWLMLGEEFDPEQEPVEDCPTLPSVDAVCRYLDGEPSALRTVARAMGTRALLMGIGMALVGERNLGRLTTYSLAGSAVIEAWIFMWVREQRKQRQGGKP